MRSTHRRAQRKAGGARSRDHSRSARALRECPRAAEVSTQPRCRISFDRHRCFFVCAAAAVARVSPVSQRPPGARLAACLLPARPRSPGPRQRSRRVPGGDRRVVRQHARLGLRQPRPPLRQPPQSILLRERKAGARSRSHACRESRSGGVRFRWSSGNRALSGSRLGRRRCQRPSGKNRSAFSRLGQHPRHRRAGRPTRVRRRGRGGRTPRVFLRTQDSGLRTVSASDP